DIQKLIGPILKDEADMVASARFSKGKPKNMSRVKYWGNKRMTSLINFLSGKKFADVSSGFRAYNREAMLNLNLFGKFTYTQEVFLDLSMKNLRIVQIPVEVKYFKERKSKVASNVLSYASKTFWIIFRTIRDYKPLKFFGGIGLFIFTAGLLFDAVLFGHYILRGTFTPYISVGFIGAYLNSVGLGVIFLALVADMFDRMRINQEKILYYEKKRLFEKE
ncbi:MAG: Glycosyl transferase family 2, partial [candidate division WS6 bacterium GW2011_GWA2_37_6]